MVAGAPRICALYVGPALRQICRMSDRPPRPAAITTGALARGGQGINLVCACGHKTALLPSQIAAAAHPDTRVLDFKRRFRCSMCGRSGATPGIKMTTFEVPAPFVGEEIVLTAPGDRPN